MQHHFEVVGLQHGCTLFWLGGSTSNNLLIKHLLQKVVGLQQKVRKH